MSVSGSESDVLHGYLRTDERIAAVDGLEMTADMLEAAEIDPQRKWKWAVIALHNAVQGFMVLALKSTWSVRVLHRSERNEMVKAEHDHRQAVQDGDPVAADAALEKMLTAEGGLAAFTYLYARIKDPEGAMRQFTHSQHYQRRPTDDQCMKCLNDIRNEFTHFVPMSRLFLLREFPAITETGLHVIDFLLNQSNNITWYPSVDEEDLEARANAALSRANAALARITAAYAHYPPPGSPLCGSLDEDAGNGQADS